MVGHACVLCGDQDRGVTAREKPGTTMNANACVVCAKGAGGAIPHVAHKAHGHLVIVGSSIFIVLAGPGRPPRP